MRPIDTIRLRSLKILTYTLLSVYALFAARYLYRTSFVVGGERYFSLWDDAMISMRYAHNLARGYGLVWNAREYVQGFSNLGLTLVMAVFHVLPVSLEKQSMVFQIFMLASLLAIVYFVGELTTRLGASRQVGFFAMIATMLFAPLGIWGMQGSDAAPLALIHLLAACRFVDVKENRRSPKALFTVLACGIFVRLDFTLVYALYFAFTVYCTSARKAALIQGSSILALTLGGILGFGWVYYGDPLPNTYYLKATGIPTDLMWQSGFEQLFNSDWGHFTGKFPGGILLFAISALYLRRNSAAMLLVATILLNVLYVVKIGGDWHVTHFSRFLVPVAPIFIVVIFAGAQGLWERLFSTRWPKLATILCILYIPILALCMNRPVSLKEWWLDEEPMLRSDNIRSVEYANLLRDHTSADTTIGVFWAGTLPYFLDRNFLDLLGKTDAHIAHVPAVPATEYWPGHAKRDWDYVLKEKKPDILVADMPEMQNRADYRKDYGVANAPIWISVRRDAASKLKR
jgi:arabinofuranosyltransferase